MLHLDILAVYRWLVLLDYPVVDMWAFSERD
jgi:hypothetical protein